MGQDITINIGVVNGKIECPRESASKNDKLTWKCDHPFAVDFGWDNPFLSKKEKIKSNKDPDAQGKKFSNPETIRADADVVGQRIRFKYTVAVCIDVDTDHPKVLIEDPEVLIDP